MAYAIILEPILYNKWLEGILGPILYKKWLEGILVPILIA